MPMSMRRATSYNEAHINASPCSPECECDFDCRHVAHEIIGGAKTLTGKHRRLLQAKKAFINHQIAEMTTAAGRLK